MGRRAIHLADGEATRAWGRAVAAHVRAGDLIVLTGELGAGKTTFTRGLGEGLGVRGAVTSPTFVIARRHPAGDRGIDLLHVDAYRLHGPSEIEDLDLDLVGAVTVVEWGAGRVDHLADNRLEITLVTADAGREAIVTGHGARWDGAAVEALLPPGHEGTVS
ncbi:MAG: tRNA (adenosine(37)-N6)-threonylcarbamoyltransferase complex ATPase subunit type 1 TsaE [Actinobacteria bacterium]|nr:tRNA (adenosine(37)-N6)-threonylcarbamoyltransferase complex ATPase subunit type 1 TsaE [Actinomycetota bacterium]